MDKILHGFAPIYLNELLFNYTPHRLLWSSSFNLLSIPIIAPKIWNDLPITIKQFSLVDSFK